MRKPSDLRRLLGRSVTDTLRMRLQTQLKLAKLRVQADPDAQVQPQGGLLGRLRAAFRRK